MILREVPHGSPDYRAAVALRRRILRLPLGLDFAADELAAESEQRHLVAVDDFGVVIGCLTLLGAPPVARMRQVAVDSDRQGQGIGQKLVEYAENYVRERGYLRIELHARQTAVDFYRRLGYGAMGEPFTEVGIPHLAMFRDL